MNNVAIREYEGDFAQNSVVSSPSTGAATMTGYERKTIQVRAWTDKAMPEFPGDRLIVLRWKGKSDGSRTAHAARYVSVPVWRPELTGKDEAFLPMLQEAFDVAQKEMIHFAVSERLNRGEEVTALSAAEFTPDMILADWETKDNGSGESRVKLSKDAINAWYDATLNDTLIVTLADRQGITDLDDEGLAKLQRSSDNYKKVLGLLASPKPVVTVDQSKLLMKALDLLPTELRTKDAVLARMVKKLEGIMSREAEEELLAGL